MSIEQLPDEILALIISQLVYPTVHGSALLVSWRLHHIMKEQLILSKYYLPRALPAPYKDDIKYMVIRHEFLPIKDLEIRGHSHPIWRKTVSDSSRDATDKSYDLKGGRTTFMSICTNGDLITSNEKTWYGGGLAYVDILCATCAGKCKCYKPIDCCHERYEEEMKRWRNSWGKRSIPSVTEPHD